MLRLDKSKSLLTRIHQPTLAEVDLLERQDLQRAIVGSWEAFREEIGMPELILLGEEVEPHGSCRDRIDLLALDPTGNLVVIELKRGSERLQLLQAIAYAGMISQWSREDFVSRVSLVKCSSKEEVERLLAADAINFGTPRVVLIAEAYDPEVILAANWLGSFEVPVTAFAIALARHDESIFLSISQRFPLPELEDVYRSRGQRKRTESGEAGTWDTVLGEPIPPVCRRAVEVLRAIKPGDPIRRRFGSIYSEGQFGGLQFNITNKHLKVYVREQSPEMRARLDELFGPSFDISTWGNEQTANAGYTFVLKRPEEFDSFIEAAKKRA